MSLKRPKTVRVYVLLTDPDSGKTRGFTIYNRSLGEVFELMKRQFEEAG